MKAGYKSKRQMRFEHPDAQRAGSKFKLDLIRANAGRSWGIVAGDWNGVFVLADGRTFMTAKQCCAVVAQALLASNPGLGSEFVEQKVFEWWNCQA